MSYRVTTIIEAAVARFYKYQALQEELGKMKTKLTEHKIIKTFESKTPTL